MPSPDLVIRVDRKALIVVAALLLIIVGVRLWSESLTLTTTYPSPAGIYNQIVTTGNSGTTPADTTLNRNAGNAILVPPTNEEGKVGVGVAAPAYKLDVSGDINFSGAVRKNGVEQSFGLPPGAIAPFAGSAVPSGWLACNGAAVSRETYAALFAAIGVAWGAGDGATTFNLPDLRGRTPIGAGQGAGLTSRTLASSGGKETHTLTGQESPGHVHVLRSHIHGYISGDTVKSGSNPPPFLAGPHPVNIPSAGGTEAWTGTSPHWIFGAYTYVLGFWTDLAPSYGQPSVGTSLFGGGAPHNIMQPYAVVSYIIKM